MITPKTEFLLTLLALLNAFIALSLAEPAQASTGQGVSIHVYQDANANGQLDPGEAAEVGYWLGVTALGENVLATEAYSTDAAGNIHLGMLPAGAYALSWLGDRNPGIAGFTVQPDSPGQIVEIGLLPSYAGPTLPRYLYLPIIHLSVPSLLGEG